MNDPSQSGPTYPFIAGLMNQLGGEDHGVAAGEAYLTKLKANGLQVFPTNGDTLHALETGQIHYGLIQSSAAVGEVLNATSHRRRSTRRSSTCRSRRCCPASSASTRAPGGGPEAEAEKFVDFVLSPAGPGGDAGR